MPFVNTAQKRACYAQQSRYLSLGLKPKWDCKKYEDHTSSPSRKSSATPKRKSSSKRKASPKRKSSASPKRKSSSKRKASSPRTITIRNLTPSKKYTIYKGPHGGKYIFYEDSKVYINPKIDTKVYIGPRGGKYRILTTNSGREIKMYV